MRKRRTLKDIQVEDKRSESTIGILKIGERRGIWYLTSFSCIPEYYGILFEDKVPQPLSILTDGERSPSYSVSPSLEFYRMKNVEHEDKLREAFLQSWDSQGEQGYIDMLWNLLQLSPGIIGPNEYMKIMTYLSVLGDDIEDSTADTSEMTSDSDLPIAQQLQDTMEALKLSFSNDNVRISNSEAVQELEMTFLERIEL